MIKDFIFLCLFLFILLNIPEKKSNQMRKCAVSAVAPCWDFFHRKTESNTDQRMQIELENQILREELSRLKKWTPFGMHLQQEFQKLLFLRNQPQDPFFERREQYLSQILSRQLQVLPAQVVFREPVNWGQSLWLNVGERDNQALGKIIVEKDSPVVVGKAVVGVVEEVGKTRCRIRLITDERLTSSVRVTRGGEQDRILAAQLKELIQTFSLREDLSGSEEMSQLLTRYLETLNLERKDLYLARGEIHGQSRLFWQMPKQKLKGVGFHYHCSDEKTDVHDLREKSVIQIGDLLVTTGMDGIFPPDLHVGIVTKILPFREGDTSYALEANPLASDLDNLKEVFVLPKRA